MSATICKQRFSLAVEKVHNNVSTAGMEMGMLRNLRPPYTYWSGTAVEVPTPLPHPPTTPGSGSCYLLALYTRFNSSVVRVIFSSLFIFYWCHLINRYLFALATRWKVIMMTIITIIIKITTARVCENTKVTSIRHWIWQQKIFNLVLIWKQH